jgi:hypothetical protein
MIRNMHGSTPTASANQRPANAHMLVLALFGIHTCSLACNEKTTSIGPLMLSFIARRPAGRPVHHLHAL